MTAPLSDKDARAAIRAWNKAKGVHIEAAKILNIPYNTFRHRFAIGKQRFPNLVKKFDICRRGAPLPEVQAKEAYDAFVAAGNSFRGGARALGMRPSTFRQRVESYAIRHNVDIAAAVEQRTIEQEVQVHRDRDSTTALKSKLRDAARLIADLQGQIKDLQWSMKASFQPAEWTLSTFAKKKREHMPALIFSDAQIGEVVRADETETGYGFDSTIFRKRFRHMIDTAIYLSFNHGGQGWVYPGFIYARLGDTISGAIHDELKETDDLTPIEAVQIAFEEEAAGITKLAEAFGRVDVKSPGAAGNHDRNTMKPQSKKAWAHSFDYLIMTMLATHFKHDKRVTFQTSKSFDIRFPIYERKIIGTHGDRMGSRGGTGFIGPAATILRGVQKVMSEQATLGFHVDEVWHGHFHYEMHLPFVKSNGCFPGYSEYAKQYRMRPALPMQQLNYYHAKRGNVDYKPLILAEN